MLTFNHDQLRIFFKRISLVEKQLYLDPLQLSSHSAFQADKIDTDGDFGYAQNRIDLAKLKECIDWLIVELGWKEGDIQIVSANNSSYIQAIDPQCVIDFLNAHFLNSESIHQSGNFSTAAFFTMDTHQTTNLSAKGIALLEDYFAKKHQYQNHTFIGDDSHLESVFSKLALVQEDVAFTLIVRLGASHWVPIHCIKQNGYLHIIEMDSEGTSKDYNRPIQRIFIYQKIEKSNLDKSKTNLYRSKNIRQSGPNNCGLFAIIDAKKMQRSPNLLEEIVPFLHDRKLLSNGLTYQLYLTPPRFENTVQSRQDHASYCNLARKLNIELNENALRIASFDKVRNTASMVKTGPDQTENMMIHYFKDKYVRKVHGIVNDLPHDELQKIVTRHSLDALSLERMCQAKFKS